MGFTIHTSKSTGLWIQHIGTLNWNYTKLTSTLYTIYPESCLHFTEPLTVLDKKIMEAFMVFDHTSSNTVDVREVGTIIRSLGKLILLVESIIDVM